MEWMEEHEDANIYISQNDWTFVRMKTNASTESIRFAEAMMKDHPDLMDRTIFILKDGEKLVDFIDEGLHNVIFYPVDEYTLENIMELKEKYNLYGFLRSYGNIDEMIREVNRTQLGPDDVLSDHAYLYSVNDEVLIF